MADSKLPASWADARFPVRIQTARFPFWLGEWPAQVEAYDEVRGVAAVLLGRTRHTGVDVVETARHGLEVGMTARGVWLLEPGRTIRPQLTDDLQPGRELAIWLREALATRLRTVLSADSSGPAGPLQAGTPIGEDYGWGFHLQIARDLYWVAVRYAGVVDGEVPEDPSLAELLAAADGATASWVVAVSPEKGCNPLFWPLRRTNRPQLAMLRTLLSEILATADGIDLPAPGSAS